MLTPPHFKATIFLAVALSFFSCGKKDATMAAFIDDVKKAGFSGQYESPKSGFEKAALSMMGIQDVTGYHEETTAFVVFEFSSPEKAESMAKDLPGLLQKLKPLIPVEVPKMDSLPLDDLQKHTHQNGKLVLVALGQKEAQIVRLFRKGA